MRETQAAKLTLLRKELKIPEPQPKWKPHTTAAKDRGLIFYGQLGVRVAVTVVCYSFALAYFKKHDYEPIKFGLLSLLNGKGLMDHAMAAVLLYGVLDLGHTVATLLVAILLQTPYVTIFNHPYLATSLRDFWSHRWNYEIKETLHHLAFIPTLKLFAPIEKEGVRAAVLWKPTPTQMGIASMAAFLMSALLHEYLIYLLIPQPLGENTLFFIIQGILCHAQVRAQKATGFGTRWGTGWMGTLFSWVSTVGIMAVTCPLFLGPYARSGLLLKYVLPVPQALVEFFSRYL
ncbi:hypothetical protein BDR26DRAFT_859453 [Obelidium mucronatum]|nr:hypothetical protein BDR26DRAFT_859453 [Obelidium mucronatum]